MFPSGERYPERSVIGEEDITDAHVVLWEMGDTWPRLSTVDEAFSFCALIVFVVNYI